MNKTEYKEIDKLLDEPKESKNAMKKLFKGMKVADPSEYED